MQDDTPEITHLRQELAALHSQIAADNRRILEILQAIASNTAPKPVFQHVAHGGGRAFKG